MTVNIGDVIECKGINCVVKKIYSQFNDDEYISCEFEDDKGIYRYWKQRYDGGKLISLSKNMNNSENNNI